jgi:PAS domain S-box-containing protein
MITRLADGKYIAMNKAYTDIVGFDSSELLGHLTTEFNIYVHLGQRAEIIEQLLAEGRLYNYEMMIRNQSGELRTVLASLERLRFNEEDCLLTTLVDITERKRAEEKLKQQNLRLKVLREIDTAILAADSVENIVGAALDHALELIECQRASMALFDWGTKEVLVFNVRAVRETSIQKGTRAPLEQFQSIIRPLSKNKPALIHDMTALPDLPTQYQALIHDGLRSMCALPLFSQSALIGSFTMYSENPGFFDEEKINLGREVANQVAIAITQSRLVDELEEHLLERETLITDLTAKNAELERFIYTVSHELKAPLVTIKGYLGYLTQDAISGNSERLKGDTQRISNAVEKMKDLLNDLLELSRIGRLMNPSQNISFDEVVRDALETVHGQLAAHGVTVHTQSGLPVVYGDRQRLTEVLQNLLDNAAKYMGNQKEPLIEIGQSGEEDGKSIFFVRDNGVGIASEYCERIFGLFNKLDASTEGTGIGLALVKRIVEVHGGRIWVESDGVPGKGSTFYFTLPRG